MAAAHTNPEPVDVTMTTLIGVTPRTLTTPGTAGPVVNLTDGSYCEAADLDELAKSIVMPIQAVEGVTRTLTCPVLQL